MRAAVNGGMQETFEPSAGHPDRIDAFRIVRKLGMGTVFLAEQDEPKRNVALNILRADLATTQSQQRKMRAAAQRKERR